MPDFESPVPVPETMPVSVRVGVATVCTLTVTFPARTMLDVITTPAVAVESIVSAVWTVSEFDVMDSDAVLLNVTVPNPKAVVAR